MTETRTAATLYQDQYSCRQVYNKHIYSCILLFGVKFISLGVAFLSPPAAPQSGLYSCLKRTVRLRADEQY
ncbi:hypothetical protein PHLGIDRAFT_226752, partial [Phlebiopsis gigantea 11061_1 CR5-6]